MPLVLAVLIGVTASLGWPVGRTIRWRTCLALALALLLTPLFSLATVTSIRGLIGIGFLTIWPSAFLLGLSIGWLFESLWSMLHHNSRIST